MKMLDVSIIIVNWNTRDILRDCLRSVYEQTKDICFEVIVVDNASSDGSAEMVKRAFPQVKLIENTENRGFAAANNQGMKMANGRYVLLLNSDTIILDGAVQESVKFANQNPTIGVLGIRNEDREGKLSRNCFQYASVLNLMISTFGLDKIFPHNRFWGRERLSWWMYDSIRNVDVVTGCYMLVRREVIDKIGMLDENYFMYGEEMDWCWQIKQAGWRVVFYPYARIIHLGRQSSSQNPLNMLKENRKSILYFIQKHEGKTARYFAQFLLVIGCALKFWYWVLRWIFSPKNSRSFAWDKVKESFIKAY